MRDRILPVGRLLRLFLGATLLFVAFGLFLRVSLAITLRAFTLFLGLVVFYSLTHFLVARFFRELNVWFGAALANLPVLLVYVFGAPGGPLLGAGEGQLAVLLYLGLALMLAGIRADPGCEVMSIPGMISGHRTHLACIAFSPLDWLEAKLANRR